MIRELNEVVFFPLRRKFLISKLADYLPEKGRILDLGCSCGRLAQALQEEKPGLDFYGVDVCLQPKCAIDIQSYDGRNIPYKDNEFDYVMIVDVLHHDIDPWLVVKEAARVAQRGIIIKDHYWDNQFGYQILKISDWWGNVAYGIDLPYNFLKMKEWADVFGRAGLTIKRQEKYRNHWFNPTNQVIFGLGL